MEMLGWINHKVGSRVLGEMSTTSDVQNDTTMMAEGEEKLKGLLIREKVKSGKVGLKFNIQKT